MVSADIRENFRALRDDSIVKAGSVNTDAVHTAGIQNLAITNAKLGGDSVTADKIAAGAVGNSELGAGAVTNAKIGGSAVTTAKISIGTRSFSGGIGLESTVYVSLGDYYGFTPIVTLEGSNYTSCFFHNGGYAFRNTSNSASYSYTINWRYIQ